MRDWIDRSVVLLAVSGKRLLGVASMTTKGVVTLNYVAPNARFTGVSKGLLSQLEVRARKLGIATLVLESTETAHRFYLATGFVDQASLKPSFSSHDQ